MIIIKVGGGAAINWSAIAQDVQHLLATEPVVLVHGASVQRDALAQKLHSPTKTIISPSGISSVYTDQHALDIFLMAYPGMANTKIVAILQAHGIAAVGLSGVDGALWRAKRKSNVLSQIGHKTKLLTDNLTGRVEKVNTHLIHVLLDSGYTPVVGPPALSYENEIVNTDNDFAVAVMARELGITRVVYLFEAPGLLRDVNDPQSVIHHIEAEKIDVYLPFAQGRMKKKVLGVKKALELGVKVIFWGDGRVKHPILAALGGEGTVITKAEL